MWDSGHTNGLWETLAVIENNTFPKTDDVV